MTLGTGGPLRLSPKQRDSMLDAVAPVNLWNGSVSSGKTFSSLLAWAHFVATAPPGALAMIGKTHDTLERNCLDELVDYFADHPGAVVHTRGSNTARIFGRLVHVLGANDRKAEDRIRGLTLAGAYVDEATLLPKGYWDMLQTRLRVRGARCYATTNPDHPRHPLKLDVIDRADELGYRVWHFTMDDNPGLPPEYVAAQKRMYAGLFFRRFILGEWVAASGAVYDMLDLDDRHRVKPDDVLLDEASYLLGVDYGTANATHAVLLAHGRRRSTAREALFVVGEWCYSGRDSKRSLTDAEQSKALREWLASGAKVRAWSTVRREVVEAGPIAPSRWSVDPAAASFKTQLRRDGVSGVREADNAVLDGLRLTGSLIAADRLLFVEGAAPTLEGQMLGYVWDDDPAVDYPAKDQEDHGCDALRYVAQDARRHWRSWLSDRATPAEQATAQASARVQHRALSRTRRGA